MGLERILQTNSERRIFLTITWDEENALLHYHKHHITFTEAASVFLDPNHTDDPDNLHPGRRTMIGLSNQARFLRVTYEKMDVIRIISARKAAPANRERYTKKR